MAETSHDDRLQNYLTGLVPPRPDEPQAMEAHAAQLDFPIIGPAASDWIATLVPISDGLAAVLKR